VVGDAVSAPVKSSAISSISAIHAVKGTPVTVMEPDTSAMATAEAKMRILSASALYASSTTLTSPMCPPARVVDQLVRLQTDGVNFLHALFETGEISGALLTAVYVNALFSAWSQRETLSQQLQHVHLSPLAQREWRV